MRRSLLAWTLASLAQGVLSCAGVAFGSLVLSIALGHGLPIMIVALLPSLLQVVLMGVAYYRLATGWPWVTYALVSTLASLLPAGIALLLVVEDLRASSPEGPNWPLRFFLLSYALPLGLMIWLLKRKTVDEWGKDIGTEGLED